MIRPGVRHGCLLVVLTLALAVSTGTVSAGSGTASAPPCGASGLDMDVAPYDANEDGNISISELNMAARDFVNGDITIAVLNEVAAAFVTGGASPGAGSTTSGPSVTVTDVVDGDTLDIEYANGTGDTVRLVGVDTPEVDSRSDPGEFEGIPDSAAGREWLSDWGQNASTLVEQRVNGTSVQLCYDDYSDRRGVFGRLLAYIYTGETTTLNRDLVANGYARVYTAEPFSRETSYLDTETDAQSANRGLWGFETPESEGLELAVGEINADAPGNDNENPNGEWVEVINTGDTNATLTGVTVSDGDGNTFAFPDRFGLDAGKTVTLYTGSGTDTETELYWGQAGAVWNNGGDTVTVRNASGGVVAQERYD